MPPPVSLDVFYAECRRRLDRPLPPNWRMMRALDTGLQYFQNDSTCATTWTTPLWPLPEGWIEKKDTKGLSYFLFENDLTPVYEDPRGIYAPQQLEGQSLPVPEHLDVRVDATGHPFFIDKRTKESFWTDSRNPQPSKYEHQRVKTPTPAKPTETEDIIATQGGPPLLLYSYDHPFQFVSMFIDANTGQKSFKDPRLPQPEGWTTRMDRRAVYYRFRDGTVQWCDPRDPLPCGFRMHLQKDGTRQFFLWITEEHTSVHTCRLNHPEVVKFDGKDVDSKNTQGVLPEGPEQSPKICYVKMGPFSQDVRKKCDIQELLKTTEHAYMARVLRRVLDVHTEDTKKQIVINNLKKRPTTATNVSIPTSPVPTVNIASNTIPQPKQSPEPSPETSPQNKKLGVQRLPTFSVRSQSATRERPSPVKSSAVVVAVDGGDTNTTNNNTTTNNTTTNTTNNNTSNIAILPYNSSTTSTTPTKQQRSRPTTAQVRGVPASNMRRQSLSNIPTTNHNITSDMKPATQAVVFSPEKGVFEDTWEKVRRLDNGAFGVIWIVQKKDISNNNNDQENEELYVTKEINLDKSDHETKQQAITEARLHSKCGENPYICNFVSFYVTPRCINMVLDFCPKGSLWDQISHRRAHFQELGYWQEEQVLWWFTQLAVAIHHVHDQNLVHLDIKPANQLLAKDWSLRLCDFGQAVNLEKQGKIHIQNTFVGTPAYASPEQMQGLKADQKTDVWAVGVLLYMLCTLQVPFGDIDARGGNVKMSTEEAHQFQALRKNILTAPVPAIPSFYSKDQRDLLNKLQAKKTRFRPTMKQVLDMPLLRKHMRNQPY